MKLFERFMPYVFLLLLAISALLVLMGAEDVAVFVFAPGLILMLVWLYKYSS